MDPQLVKQDRDYREFVEKLHLSMGKMMGVIFKFGMLVFPAFSF